MSNTRTNRFQVQGFPLKAGFKGYSRWTLLKILIKIRNSPHNPPARRTRLWQAGWVERFYNQDEGGTHLTRVVLGFSTHNPASNGKPRTAQPRSIFILAPGFWLLDSFCFKYCPNTLNNSGLTVEIGFET